MSFLFKPLALVSTLAFSTLGLLSRRYQKARFYFHLTLYMSTMGVISIWGVVISILATAAGQRLNINYLVARSFYGACSPLIGIKFEVEGEEHLARLLTARGGRPQSAVLVGNHQSTLDILYLGRIFPQRAAIMAKQELKWAPLLGQYMSLSGAVFVNRKNRKDAVKTMQQAGDDMKKKGVSLWVFPEGTRSSSANNALLPFKKGAFHLAVQAQVPIIPVVCENYHRLFDGRTRMESGILRIRILPPIVTTGLSSDDVTPLAESTRQSMLDALNQISVAGPSSQPDIPIDSAEAEPVPTSLAPEETAQVDEGVRQRSASAETEKERSGETTEDEMDDDAVLLKRPKAD
ncbi:lysophosphatidate acyltransferase, partial [Tremellales sp. Uapishka_1]